MIKLKYLVFKTWKTFVIFVIVISFISFKFMNNNNYQNNMIVHYIDIGQGDCILIQVNNKNLLIDSGPSSNRTDLLNYLENINIKNFDYIIATHPHEDHIGNMDTLVRRYNVSSFYAPKVTHSSVYFENMISALIDKNLKINILKKGTTGIDLGKNTKVYVFSPDENMISDNLNDYSPIIKIVFFNTSFLFTGDAEILSENMILSEKFDLKADILKIAHHGSSTSSSNNFITSVSPSVAIISVGNDNSYGHPSSDILNRLKSKNIKILRTDTHGNIIATSDGNSIKISYTN